MTGGVGCGVREHERLQAGIVFVAVSAGSGVIEIFPWSAPDGERARAGEGLGEQVGADGRGGFAAQGGQQVETVFGGVVGQLGVDDGSDGRHHVGEAGELSAGGAGFHLGGPADEEGHAMASFPTVAFDAAPRSRAVVAVIGAHVDDAGDFRAVVAGEDDEGVVGDAEFLERAHQLADHPIELVDKVAVRPGTGLSLELRRGERGQMHGLRSVVEEEGFARRCPDVLLQKLAALFQKDEVHFLHGEIRGDETGAAVVRVGVFRQLRFVERTGGRHGHAVTIDEGVNPIGRGAARGAEECLKPVVHRPTFDAATEVDALHFIQFSRVNRFARLVAERQAHMPFADRSGGVALRLQHRRQRQATRSDQGRSAGTLEHRAAIRHAKRHLASHQTVARGRADRGGTVRIGEAHPVAREPVEMRRGDLRLGVVAAHIPVTEVVSEDEQDVGFLSRACGRKCCTEGDNNEREFFHDTTTTAFPSTSIFGVMPRPGDVEAAMRPFTRCGAPSAMLTGP